jgi:hypothetical protein
VPKPRSFWEEKRIPNRPGKPRQRELIFSSNAG